MRLRPHAFRDGMGQPLPIVRDPVVNGTPINTQLTRVKPRLKRLFRTFRETGRDLL